MTIFSKKPAVTSISPAPSTLDIPPPPPAWNLTKAEVAENLGVEVSHVRSIYAFERYALVNLSDRSRVRIDRPDDGNSGDEG